MIKPLFLSFVLVLVAACSRTSSADTARLADVYVEILLLDEQYKRSDSTSTAERHEQEIDKILAKFSMTKKEFRSGFESVATSPEEFHVFYELVNKKLMEKAKS